MKIYEGEIKLIGAGTTGNDNTKVSAFDIGSHSLKNIILTHYLRNYLTPGANAKILVATGLSQGIITRPVIIAAEVNGKKYKEGAGQLLFMNFVKALCYCALAVLIYVFSDSPTVPLIIGLLSIGYYVKEYFDFMKF